MSDEENRDQVRTLLDQLKENNKLIKSTKHNFILEKKDLEQFILNNTGRLITDSMETIDNIKQYIISAPEPEDVHSLAELYKASTSAIEALNKVLLQQQKSDTQIAVKTMDIEAKQQLLDDNKEKITFTRDEIFNKLVEKADVIDITQSLPEESQQSPE